MNLPSKSSWTALDEAASEGHLECVKLLVNKGGADVSIEDSEGQTSLHRAVIAGHYDVVFFRLKQNIELND